MNKWISVEDRLPEDEQIVLLYTKNPHGDEQIFIGYRERRRRWDVSSEYVWLAKPPVSLGGYVISEQGDAYMKPRKVTHWMPLPESPK